MDNDDGLEPNLKFSKWAIRRTHRLQIAIFFILSNFGLYVLSKKSMKFTKLHDFHWSARYREYVERPKIENFGKKEIAVSKLLFLLANYVKISNIGMAKNRCAPRFYQK